jgi:hypothetical protein
MTENRFSWPLALLACLAVAGLNFSVAAQSPNELKPLHADGDDIAEGKRLASSSCDCHELDFNQRRLTGAGALYVALDSE